MTLDNPEIFKSMPFDGYDTSKKYSLLSEEFMLPVAVVKHQEMMKNAQWMQTYSQLTGVSLCPHGKTTMTPKLFKVQMECGAWGITLANSFQLKVARKYGIKRVLMANQLVGRQNILSVLNELVQEDDFDFYCLVDSNSNVLDLSQALKRFSNVTLNVLMEISPDDGRAGLREYSSALELAHCLKQQPNINLVGVECFEGVISGPNTVERVESFLEHVLAIARHLDNEGMFEGKEIILSAGGSAFYDLVVKVFSSAKFSKTTRVVIRPGCYLSHDNGIYSSLQNDIKNRDRYAQEISGNLEPAVEVLAYIQSLPEPNLAIINMGKRDVSFDAGLPVPLAIFDRHNRALMAISHSTLTKINDQHAFMEYKDDYIPSVGDIVIFGISHPCLTFDKWKHIALVDQYYNVIELLKTYF